MERTPKEVRSPNQKSRVVVLRVSFCLHLGPRFGGPILGTLLGVQTLSETPLASPSKHLSCGSSGEFRADRPDFGGRKPREKGFATKKGKKGCGSR